MTLPQYEKPTLARISQGALNKFGSRLHSPVLASVEGVGLAGLLAAHGSPLFVFSEARLRARVRDLRAAFELRYPKVRLAWSYKTNCLGAICRVLHQEGAWAEVVSAFELDRALELGVPGERIIFNGPYKPVDSLRTAVRVGALVNVDNHDEIAALEAVTDGMPSPPAVGLRVNLSAPGAPAWDRFGFNLENGHAMAVIERIRSRGRLRLAALHCHLGTYILEPRAYKVAAAKMVELLRTVETRLGFKIEQLDLGGGFASGNNLRGRYLPGADTVPSFSAYAEALVEGLGDLARDPDPPTLFLETGRAVVDDSGFLAATVVASKMMTDGRRALVADCGSSILPTAAWYRHEIRPAVSREGEPVPTAIFGPLCMQIDVLVESLMLPPLIPGDPIVILNAGAYNVTQWSQFTAPRPAVVLIRNDRSVEVIRRREQNNDLTFAEKIPDDLLA